MSAAAAFALPHRTPAPGAPQSRHIEIVSTRNQRRARPRLAYSLVIIGGLFAVLASQLLLSIALADGAYQISTLQTEQKELARAHQAVTEELNVLGSPQNLAARAESLGMVSNNSAVYLNLADGTVMGSPSAAGAEAGSVIGANGNLLVANALLTGVPGTMDAADSQTVGAPVSPLTAQSVTSTSTGIPGPATR